MEGRRARGARRIAYQCDGFHTRRDMADRGRLELRQINEGTAEARFGEARNRAYLTPSATSPGAAGGEISPHTTMCRGPAPMVVLARLGN